jgi:hypothetical protein
MTRGEILALLETGDFAPLVGERENVQVEFKRQPQLHTSFRSSSY